MSSVGAPLGGGCFVFPRVITSLSHDTVIPGKWESPADRQSLPFAVLLTLLTEVISSDSLNIRLFRIRLRHLPRACEQHPFADVGHTVGCSL